MRQTKKEIIVIAGGNGVGKTTFARAFLQEYDYEFLNADEIAKSLSAENPAGKKISAGKLFFQRLNEAITQNKSLLIESTLSGRYLQKFIERLQKQDYQIRIVFLFVESTEILIERIAERVKKDGHFVPDEDVKRRFMRGKQNFWKTYRNLATRWSLVYNSDRNFQEVAFGEKDEFLIADENLFQIFESEIK
ncbi:MAG: zeta toxin family protein [Acidobacteriota bacterium]|nr:zeta toxin family protein [Acidobacteriota bacterium]